VSDDWAEADAFTDASGKHVSIGHAHGSVRIAIQGAGITLTAIVLDGGGRERFDQAYLAASRGAERAEVNCG